MPPERHAKLGASKAHQWLECPPSVVFEEKFPEEPTSEAAEEGKVAHKLAEYRLTKLLEGKRPTTPADIRKHPLFRLAMEEYVGVYCDEVLRVYNEMKQAGDPVIYLEQELDTSEYIPDGFGTADCIIIGDGTMHVFDLKYGKGVPVTAEENPQLKIYGLGALEEFGYLYDIKEVTLHIVQPRLDSITEWTISVDILKNWGKYIVKPTAEAAFKGEGDFHPGESQCRWCRGKARCRAYNEYVLSMARDRFDVVDDHERQPNELSDEEIGQMLKDAEEIKGWAKKITDYALEQATNNGAHFPGWKLVAGRSNRKITDEGKVVEILAKNTYGADRTCKLKGITDLEDLVGKKKLAELIGDYIIKPQGKPTLVPESDKRPEYEPEIKFEEVNEEEN